MHGNANTLNMLKTSLLTATIFFSFIGANNFHSKRDTNNFFLDAEWRRNDKPIPWFESSIFWKDIPRKIDTTKEKNGNQRPTCRSPNWEKTIGDELPQKE
eukprot:TRINITY_DN27213_c0_g1_i1.p1 TRINITY_DN27213_c0_g1~~TRINITY_DN27213_c0_g1_i1.p1  ORF type:complete len:100 (+),score=11.32 TRINITY_DN27213_c0_g1_i1:135-434(+)